MSEKERKERLVTNIVIEPQAGAITCIRRQGADSLVEANTEADLLTDHGTICVRGTATDGIIDRPDEVRAFVFRGSQLSSLTDMPPGNAIEGVIGDFSDPKHNYRFIRDDPEAGEHRDVPLARDNHTHEDPDNHLVVWTRFGKTWEKSAIVQFKGDSRQNITECEKAEQKELV